MATELEILEVVESLPPEAETLGWGAPRIGDILDSGISTTKTILRFWRYRAGQTANLVDVSESGSSRQLSKIHDQALNMVKYWEDRSKAEDEELEEPVVVTGRVQFHTATRV